MAPRSELRISGRRAMPDSSVPVVSAFRVSSRSSSLEATGCRYSMISWSPISLRAHWIVPTPMHSSASPRQMPRATLEAPSPRNTSGLVTDLEPEVGDAEQQREDGRETEQAGDLALRALLRGDVDVGRSGLVRGEAGIGDRFGLEGGELALLAHGCVFFLERVELAPIQTAAPTRAPMPTSHANRPSETGPIEPRVKPP